MSDALGSVTGTLNASQAVVNTYRYKPYGELLAKTGSAADPAFMWNGTTQSRRTGLTFSDQYNRARHYGTRQGQWTTVDPLWPRERVLGYCNGNPTSSVDPSGLFPVSRELMSASYECCGGYKVDWDFGITDSNHSSIKKGGWLIQRIEFKQDIKDCGGEAIASPCPSFYFEAWKLVYSKEFGWEVARPVKDGSWEASGPPHDFWEGSNATCRTGSRTVRGELMIAAALPPEFKRGKVACAGDLPSSETFSGWKSHGGASQLTLTFACCRPPAPCPEELDFCNSCKTPGKCQKPVISVVPNQGTKFNSDCRKLK